MQKLIALLAMTRSKPRKALNNRLRGGQRRRLRRDGRRPRLLSAQIRWRQRRRKPSNLDALLVCPMTPMRPHAFKTMIAHALFSTVEVLRLRTNVKDRRPTRHLVLPSGRHFAIVFSRFAA